MSIVHEVRKHILLSGRWMLLLGIFMVPLIVWGVLNSGQSGVWVRVIRLGTVSLMWFVLPLMWLRTRYCVWLFGLAIISVVAETGHLLVTSAFFNAGTMRSVLATNPGEAAELMGSLLPFLPLIALIPVLYFLLVRHPLPDVSRSRFRWWLPLLPLMMLLASEGVDYHRSGVSYRFGDNSIKALTQVPPANIYFALGKAWSMERHIRQQQAGYRDFSYQAHSEKDTSVRQVCVVVIGESARADHFGLNGYARNTTPRLSARGDVISYEDFFTSANVTLYSIPLMLTRFGADEFDRVHSEPSLVSAFHEAGFRTGWISNQGLMSDPHTAFIMDVDKLCDFPGYQNQIYDEVVLPCLREMLSSRAGRICVFVHLMGNHVAYNARHPKEFEVFRPSLSDGSRAAVPANREYFVNSYDNSVLYQDYILSRIIGQVDSLPGENFVLYLADHGESLFDQGSQLFGHTGDPPVREQVHVPFLVWLSPEYRMGNPEQTASLEGHRSAALHMDDFFFTLLDMAGVRHRFEDPAKSFADSLYIPHDERRVVAPSGRIVTFPHE